MARLEVIASDQGLSQGMIYDILQDQEGFLWFGTRDGLNRYDGYTFRVYKNDPYNQFSISDNIIEALFEDRQGRIWIGTESNGLNIFDPVSGKFYHLNKGVKGLPDQNVNAFAETQEGAVWVGTQNGLCRVELPLQLPLHDPDLSSVAKTEHVFWETNVTGNFSGANSFISLQCTDDGMLWVGTAQAAYRFDPATRHKDILPIQEVLDPKIRIKANFFTIGPDGSVWIGQYNRMLKLSRNGEVTATFLLPASKDAYVAHLSFDKEGNLFVSKRKEIYLYLNKDLGGEEKPVLMPQPQTFFAFPQQDVIGSTKILCDKNGLIWIGTNGYGIRKYNPVNRLFNHYLPGVSTRKIIVDKEGRFWAWRIPGMFFLLDEIQREANIPALNTPDFFQHAAVFSRDGYFWVLAEQKEQKKNYSWLIRKHLKTGLVEHYATEISSGIYGQLLEDSKGNIWMSGAQSELGKFNPATGQQRRYDLSMLTGFKESALALYEDHNGDIWVGTSHGLVRGALNADKNDFNFTVFQNNPDDINSLNNNYILSMRDDVRDPSRYLWVGTRGGGLNLLNKSTGVCQHFTPADGLPSDVVYGILTDGNGCLWMSTNSGLSKFNPITNHFENYSAADGLQDNEFNTFSYANNTNGRMVFGGVNGLTVFDPKLINPMSVAPDVQITALRIQNTPTIPGDGILQRSIEKTQSITLQYHQNDLTLEFVALDFATPHKNQFRYRLLGANEQWSEATYQHATTFSNLPPGTYTFEVLTGGAHGLWSGAPARLEIKILAPWWRSKLAYLAYSLLAAWLIWEVYRIQVRRIQLQEQVAFEHREAERIRAVELIKTNFFTNITHELRTPVTLILEPLRQILQQPGRDNWLSKVQLAETNSQKLLQLVNQLLDLAKLDGGAMRPEFSRGQVSDLLTELAGTFVEKARNKGIEFRFGPLNGPIAPFYFDAEKVDKIVSNLLSNALKFTPEGGIVDLNWQMAPSGWFVLEVKDTGPGIREEDVPKVFDRFFSTGKDGREGQQSTGIGLALCRELAALMGGRVEVVSAFGEGAVFRLMLPGSIAEGDSLKEHVATRLDPDQTHAPKHDSVQLEGIPAENTPYDSTLPLLLLVEDSDDLRHFIAQTLSDKFEVLEAANGQEAVNLAFERIPDIIVSDLMMPLLDGIGLLDAIKSDVRTSHIPLLLLTAKAALSNRIEGLKHGADAYLGKPFQTEELLAWLENLLEGRKRLQLKYMPHPHQHTSWAQSSDDAEAGSSAREIKLGLLDQNFLERLRVVVEQEIDNERVTPEDIARQMAMSRSQLHRKLIAITGLSATEFLRNHRLDRALQLLEAGAGNVSEIAWRVGFVNAKHFSTSFKERFGKSPSEI